MTIKDIIINELTSEYNNFKIFKKELNKNKEYRKYNLFFWNKRTLGGINSTAFMLKLHEHLTINEYSEIEKLYRKYINIIDSDIELYRDIYFKQEDIK